MKKYCSQNNGNCLDCSLANYVRDCHNNKIIMFDLRNRSLNSLTFEDFEPLLEDMEFNIANSGNWSGTIAVMMARVPAIMSNDDDPEEIKIEFEIKNDEEQDDDRIYTAERLHRVYL